MSHRSISVRPFLHARGRWPATRRRIWLQTLEDRTAPAVFTVNDPGELGVGSGLVGDLRYCINEANINGEADVINIQLTAPNTTISLNSPLTISELFNLTITVPDGQPAVTIDGNDITRIFVVNTTSQVTINNLTMTRGNAGAGDGGAIQVVTTYGNLAIGNCTISNSKTDGATGNSGGGIALAGKGNLQVMNSTLTGNVANKGAAIYFFSGGSAQINGCTFTLNQQVTSPTGGGGAIYFFGAPQAPGFTISNTTIHNNKADTLGGGIRLRQITNAFPFIIRNCTITGNSAGTQGGGIYVTSAASIGTVEIISTIISGNTNPSSPDIYGTTTIVRLNNSAIGSLVGFNLDTANSKDNIVGADLKLGPLASNGGPTQTRLPGAGSPVRDKGSNPAPMLTTDQRGQPRLLGSAVDIGSVESVDPAPTGLLDPFGPIVTAGPTPNTLTVTYTDSQSTINHATIQAGNIEIIQVKSGTKLAVTSGVPDAAVNGSPRQGIYTFTPPGGAWDPSDNGTYQVVLLPNQVFDTDSPTPNAAAAGLVGTFNVEVPLHLVVDITADEDDGNTAPGDLSLREAIRLANESLGSLDVITFDPVVFATPQTITLTLGQLTITDNVNIIGPSGRVTIDGNAASRVIRVAIPDATKSASFSNLVIQNGKLTGETGDSLIEDGAGLFTGKNNVTITNCIVQNNTTQANGGGIFVQSTPGKLTVVDSVIRNNTTTATVTKLGVGSGGGIAVDLGGTLILNRSTVSNNTASKQGGGIYFYSGGSFEITNSTISGNKADGGSGGGGLYFFGTAAKLLKISNSTFSGNVASIGPGGGIALKTFRAASQLQITNSTIVFNQADFGGGISRQGGDSTIPLNISSTIVANNSVVNPGGIDISLDFTASEIPGNNNLIGVTGDGGFIMTGMNNIVGDAFDPADPMLDPMLANNGGPTLTHKLLAGSKAIDAGIANGLTTDQRGGAAVRLFNDPGVPNGPGSDGTDIGAFERQPVVAPTVTKVEFNGGAVQRSMVTSATVTFSESVLFPDGILAAFQLNRYANGSPTGLVNLSAVQLGNTVNLTFVGGGTVGIDPGGSLQDGTYELTIVASKVQGGLSGMAANTSSKVHRLFGDANGDGAVTATDFNFFRLDYGTTGNSIFDFDGNGSVTAADFNAFRLRYGASGYQP
jgi:parallel beta-helix repeat protein